MCSSGGPMADLSMKKLKTKKYKCLDCGNDFKGLGKKVICPSKHKNKYIAILIC